MITAYEVVEIGRSDDRKSDHHRAAVTKMTDSNVVIRNLSVMSTDALVCVLKFCLIFFCSIKFCSKN